MSKFLSFIAAAFAVFALAGAAFAVFALAGCSPVSGTVIDKKFVPKHTKTEYVPVSAGEVCVSDFCTPLYNYINYENTYPDAWYIVVRDKDGDNHRVYVSHAKYKTTEKGSWYDEEGKSKPKPTESREVGKNSE